MDRGMYAAELFHKGYNCAQAVFASFGDVTGLDEKTAAKMASSFGGGMGRLREVCGAVSGMLMAVSMLYGYDNPGEHEEKKELYTLVQELAGKFQAEAGSIICRDILKNPDTTPIPELRTEEYYKHRPCISMVVLATQILDQYIKENPPCKN